MTTSWKAIDAAITAHLPSLQKPGVLALRPGFKMTAGKMTPVPAIIATVAHKGPVAPDQCVPPMIAGYPTDVRQASSLELLRRDDPQAFAAWQLRGPAEYTLPLHDHERDAATGALLQAPSSAALPKSAPLKPYQPAPGVALDAVSGKVDLILHASPDAGWLQLRPFLAGTTHTLTVGMYDFTSAHILDAVVADLAGKQQMSLVLDHPAKNPTADQTDEQTEAALQAALHKRLAFAWAAEAHDPKVNAAYFPNAYHIKVAVRDGSTFWLSSGNWNNSNQPDIDPFKHRAGADAIAAKSDRDWHVIVSHAGLAKTFEAYLLHDLAMARTVQQTQAAAFAEALPELETVISPLGKAPVTYFKPKVLTGVQARIQPVLTPDAGAGNYVSNFLALIQSARSKLYLQTQYIHPPQNGAAPGFTQLLDAVVAQMRAGIDVRIILSQYETTSGWLEKLQAAGFDLSKVRIQTGVHNKGFIVDTQVVAIGSQNWSGDGVLHNRDASLIIHNAEAAAYFEAIFLHDWVNMATPAA